MTAGNRTDAGSSGEPSDHPYLAMVDWFCCSSVLPEADLKEVITALVTHNIILLGNSRQRLFAI